MKLKDTVALQAEAKGPCGCNIGVGDEVIVDGLRGRGVVTARDGRRLTVRFREGMYVSRDQRYVHSFIENTYKSRYQSQ
jgi:hypothetical protein